MVSKYRKKPVVIEAIEWTGKNFADIKDFTDGKRPIADNEEYKTLIISTLEGDHHANVGDFIIKGVKGECYPCKPDIFAMTYEKVEE